MNIELIKNLKVLYVEDEVILRDTTCNSLKSILKEIVVADNGKEGLEKFKNDKFDLIISDLAMPVMGGSEMIEKIREIDNNIPIIVTTAYGSQNEEVETLINIGMSDYVMKPVDIMKLVETIDKIMEQTTN
ncbi:MAG: response regulator [Campylobacterota bacterium]|nr:response regulator [Campylobacterota bacterium]